MNKRGQLTFILFIIGLTLLTFIIFYYERNTISQEELKRDVIKTNIGAETNQIKVFAESCLHSSLKHSISRVIEQGGYIDPRGNPAYGEEGCEDYTYHNGSYVAYLLIGDDSSNMLPIPIINEKLEKYTLVTFDNCMNLSFFDQRGYDFLTPDIAFHTIDFDYSRATVDYSDIKIEPDVSIGYRSISSFITYPIEVQKSKNTAIISEFHSDVNFDFHHLYEKVQKIIEDAKTMFPSEYDLSANCVDFEPYKIYNNGTIIKVKAFDYLQYGEAAYFTFAIKDSNIVGECP